MSSSMGRSPPALKYLSAGLGAMVLTLAAGPSQAAITWFSSAATWEAAAPGAVDATGMSSVTSLAQSTALMEAAGGPWANNAALDQEALTVGSLTFTAPNSAAAYSHGFWNAAPGIAGYAYSIGNPINEDHAIDIAGGASAFSFKIYEPGGYGGACGTPCVYSSFNISAYDADGALLGSYGVNPAWYTTAFVGVVSDVAIARIAVSEGQIYAPYGCCVYDNEYFGEHRMVAAAPVSAVPEPSTWAMLIAGFATLGAALRRRRVAPLTA